jgi:hypothetical protein
VVVDERTVTEKRETGFFVTGAERLSEAVVPSQEAVYRKSNKAGLPASVE